MCIASVLDFFLSCSSLRPVVSRLAAAFLSSDFLNVVDMHAYLFMSVVSSNVVFASVAVVAVAAAAAFGVSLAASAASLISSLNCGFGSDCSFCSAVRGKCASRTCVAGLRMR